MTFLPELEGPTQLLEANYCTGMCDPHAMRSFVISPTCVHFVTFRINIFGSNLVVDWIEWLVLGDSQRVREYILATVLFY